MWATNRRNKQEAAARKRAFLPANKVVFAVGFEAFRDRSELLIGCSIGMQTIVALLPMAWSALCHMQPLRLAESEIARARKLRTRSLERLVWLCVPLCSLFGFISFFEIVWKSSSIENSRYSEAMRPLILRSWVLLRPNVFSFSESSNLGYTKGESYLYGWMVLRMRILPIFDKDCWLQLNFVRVCCLIWFCVVCFIVRYANPLRLWISDVIFVSVRCSSTGAQSASSFINIFVW